MWQIGTRLFKPNLQYSQRSFGTLCSAWVDRSILVGLPKNENNKSGRMESHHRGRCTRRNQPLAEYSLGRNLQRYPICQVGLLALWTPKNQCSVVGYLWVITCFCNCIYR